jgi:hypothetical protein
VACYLYTAKQDEVRATEVSDIDPLSPLAQEAPEEVVGA